MQKFKVILNHSGELHTFYTTTSTPSRALRNAVTRLAKKLKVNYTFLLQKFNTKDNFKVLKEN
jgi:hypothetical protein